MEAWLLREWQRTSAWQLLLRPLSWLYASVIALRRALYRGGVMGSTRIAVPVIVVGNITVGGTGKTPLVLAVVQKLTHAGWRCGIVSRGYMRGSTGDTSPAGVVNQVDAQSSTQSDEARLLASRAGVPVFISADRPAAARALLAAFPDVNVIVADDGLQHYALQRDIEICVVDAARGFGNGALLPAGPLREPVSRLATVDAIVLNDASDALATRIPGLDSEAQKFPMSLGNEVFIRVRDGKVMTIEEAREFFRGKAIAAVAGTGNPARFFTQLSALGFATANTHSFPDHHAYVAADLAMPGTDIVLMTEKDAVKCSAFADERMWFMRVDAILPDAFGVWITQRLSALKR